MTTALDARTQQDRMDRFYRLVRASGRFWLWFFFKSVDRRHPERVPDAGPTLLCINHPNNFIDSLLVGAAVRRKVHYLATAALFRNPLGARFLGACGAIPVYRKQDDPNTMDRNTDTFAACSAALAEGRLIAIYPEGTTHAEARVQRIKTGAARIALAYEAEHPGELRLVPVGLTFEARKIDATQLVRAVEELYRGELTRELQEERGLPPKQIDPIRLSRAIVDAVSHFKAHDPERVERLWQRIQGYRALLAEHHIKDEAVRARLELPRRARRIRLDWQAVAGFPLFAFGACVNFLPYWIPRWTARRMARKETDYATWRFLASVVAYPLFWGIEIWLVAWLLGAAWALAFALALPLSGIVAYRYWVGAGRLTSRLRLNLLALTREHAARRLTAERQAIIGELERAKTEYLAATKGSPF